MPPPATVRVDLDAGDLGERRHVGTLRRVGAGPGTVVAFAFDPTWLGHPDSFVLDPSLGPYEGDQYPPDGSLPGVLSDAAPDRWGRLLLERREAARARAECRPVRSLGDWDFLLGVSDRFRTGALRLVSADGRVLDDDPAEVPPATHLRELEAAAREIEDPGAGPQGATSQLVAMLLAPGSSLGGARPKATYIGDDDSPWMAKFPSRNDRTDVGAWEFVLNELGAAAGIDVPSHRLLDLAGPYRTFAARRFDRDGVQRRLYASAMTMVQRRDREPASYLDIALAIQEYGAQASIDADLAQLFRRVAFAMMTSHRDDHLRNHGFLRTPDGWRLAPAFDLNPIPSAVEHELAIDEATRIPDMGLLQATAPFYRLRPDEAAAIVVDVRTAVAGWHTTARSIGIPRDEIDGMVPAFMPDSVG